MGILDACELFTFSPKTALVFENAVERLFYSGSFRTGGATLPQNRVRAKLRRLNCIILQDVERKLHANLDKEIKNSTAYVMAAIFNGITESESDLMVDPYLNSLRAAGGEVKAMLLSVQQKFILGTLCKLGCIRRRQLHALVRGRFSDLDVSEARMEAMLRQLRMCVGDVRLGSDLVCLSDAQPNALRLEAIDIMLELAEGMPQDFTTRPESPRLLL